MISVWTFVWGSQPLIGSLETMEKCSKAWYLFCLVFFYVDFCRKIIGNLTADYLPGSMVVWEICNVLITVMMIVIIILIAVRFFTLVVILQICTEKNIEKRCEICKWEAKCQTRSVRFTGRCGCDVIGKTYWHYISKICVHLGIIVNWIRNTVLLLKSMVSSRCLDLIQLHKISVLYILR